MTEGQREFDGQSASDPSSISNAAFQSSTDTPARAVASKTFCNQPPSGRPPWLIPASRSGLSNVARYKNVSEVPSAREDWVSFCADCAFGIPTNNTSRILPLSNLVAAQMLWI